MDGAFYAASAFDGDIRDWDVSKVTSMYGTFYGAAAYRADDKYQADDTLVIRRRGPRPPPEGYVKRLC